MTAQISISFQCSPEEAQMMAALYAALTGDIFGETSNINILPKALLLIQDNLLDEAITETELLAGSEEAAEVAVPFSDSNWGLRDRLWMDEFIDLDADEVYDSFMDHMDGGQGNGGFETPPDRQKPTLSQAVR